MEIRFHHNFKKRFKKLPVKIREQFYDRLDLFLKDQTDRILNNHMVDKAYSGCRSINVSGDYRAIFKDLGSEVIFLKIGTHSELY